MSEDVYQCWSCQHIMTLSWNPPPIEGDMVQCPSCGTTCVIQDSITTDEHGAEVGRTLSVDQDYEARCDSQESARCEESAHGRPANDNYYIEEGL